MHLAARRLTVALSTGDPHMYSANDCARFLFRSPAHGPAFDELQARDGGAAHGRLTLVRVSGYTAAADVQRDLQRIREMPGGYGDARIVGQQ